MYLNIGDRAPKFNIKNYNNELVTLDDFKGSCFVLWFFPKANTPG